jgi:hypothetical protein
VVRKTATDVTGQCAVGSPGSTIAITRTMSYFMGGRRSGRANSGPLLDGVVRRDRRRAGLQLTFHGRLRPISEQFVPAALAVSKFSRQETLAFPNAGDVMREFGLWIADSTAGRPIFISDNNGFDWQFIHWYFHAFLGKNPFGHSSTNLGSLYKGLVKDMSKNFKKLLRTRHTPHRSTTHAAMPRCCSI